MPLLSDYFVSPTRGFTPARAHDQIFPGPFTVALSRPDLAAGLPPRRTLPARSEMDERARMGAPRLRR